MMSDCETASTYSSASSTSNYDLEGMGRRRRRGHGWTRKKRSINTPIERKKESWEDALNEIYTTVGGPGAFSSSPFKLQKILIKNYNITNVTLKQIAQWLKRNYSHSIHTRADLIFKRNQIIATDLDEQWQGDLFFIDEFKSTNKGFKCGLVMIDVVSRFAWGELMTTKKGPATTEALKKILERSEPRKPKRIQTDQGTEFLNQTFQNFLKQRDIDFFFTYSDHKAAIAERFIKTLKTLIFKYLDENQTNVYWDKFQDIIQSYNDTFHSTIQTEPSSVTQTNVGKILGNLYGHLWKSGDRFEKRKNQFKIGDYVRLSKIHSATFKKGYRGNWTEEIFQIKKIKNTFPFVTYGIQDLNMKEVLGSYYAEEIQKVPEVDFRQQYWKIEKVLDHRTLKSGKKESLVKWVGYDNSFNSWIPVYKIKTLKR